MRYLHVVFNEEEEWERGEGTETWMDEPDIARGLQSFFNQLKKYSSLLKVRPII